MGDEDNPKKKQKRDPNKCYADGFCWVYEQTDSEEEGGTQSWGYNRMKGTEWCKCTREQCIVPCPNSFLCGISEYPKSVLACHDMQCTNCNITIGRNLELVTGEALPQAWECSICMEQRDKACVFPDCPAKHSFCLDCMKKLLWGVPNPRYNPDNSDNDEYPYEGSTNACPTCRHSFDPSEGWSSKKNKN